MNLKTKIEPISSQIHTKLSKSYRKANKYTGGSIGIMRIAFNSFSDAHGAEGAAAVAYFVFFSLIPLLLLLVSIAGFFLVDIDAIDQILDIVSDEIPLPRELIENNLRQLLNARNIGGIVAIIGLAWSASGSFLSLARNINRAWSRANRLNVVQGRLFALAIIAALVILLIIWYAATNIFNYVSTLLLPYIGEIEFQQTSFWQLSTGATPWVIVFFAFFVLYKWIPNTKVFWAEALAGAIPATITIFIATRLFTWFLSTGIVNFQIIYGSLGTLLGFLTWVYITAFIAIMGAHISSAVASERIRRKKMEKNKEISSN